MNFACTRRQAEQEAEGVRQSVFRQGEVSIPSPFRMLSTSSGE